MRELILIVVVAAILGTLVVAIVTAGLALQRSRLTPLVAKVCRVLALVVAVLDVIVILASLLPTFAAASAPGLTDADRARMLSDGIIGTLVAAFFPSAVAVAAFLVARWALQRRAER